MYFRHSMHLLGLLSDCFIAYNVEDDGYVEIDYIIIERVHIEVGQRKGQILELKAEVDLAAVTPSEHEYLDSICREHYRQYYADAELERQIDMQDDE